MVTDGLIDGGLENKSPGALHPVAVPLPASPGESTDTTFANQVFVVFCTPPHGWDRALHRQEGPLLKGSRHALFASEGMSENGKPLRLI